MDAHRPASRGARARRARRSARPTTSSRARAAARSGVRRLGDEPRDGAREAARREAARPRAGDHRAPRLTRARASERPRSRARASSTSASRRTSFAEGLRALIAADDQYGRSNAGRGVSGQRRVRVGESDRAAARRPRPPGGARRRDLRRCSSATGWRVTREFYYNDAGAQIMNLALSVQARVREFGGQEVEFPEGGYHGEYIREISRSATSTSIRRTRTPTIWTRVRRFAVRELRKEQDRDLQAFGVQVRRLLSRVVALHGRARRRDDPAPDRRRAHVREGRRALAARRPTSATTRIASCAKRGEGRRRPTYFVPDVAYHVTKWERGFTSRDQRAGRRPPQHRDARARRAAGARHGNSRRDIPEYVLHQMVTVMRGGEEVKISKRAGSYVTVRDLIDEVGRDAVRYFFLMRKGDSQLVFDVDVARSQSDENPVYYIQMAHARMSGIFRVGEIDPASITGDDVDLSRADAARRAGADEGAARLSRRSSPARPTRSSRTASRRICTTRPARFTCGTTRRTCSTSPSRSCARGSCSRAPRRSCCGMASSCSESRRRSACDAYDRLCAQRRIADTRRRYSDLRRLQLAQR